MPVTVECRRVIVDTLISQSQRQSLSIRLPFTVARHPAAPLSKDLKETRRAHATADAHGHDRRLGAAPLAL